MSEVRSAGRYALAVISVAEEVKAVDIVSKDFEFLEKMISDVREFALFLRSPVVNMETKKTILSGLLKGNVGELTSQFVLLLVVKRREGLLHEIIKQFYRLRDERKGLLNVTAHTAVKFTEGQQQELVRRIEEATKKKARVKYVVDSSLQGGFTIRHEDTVWDASVRHQLEVLRQKFMEANG